MGIILFGIVIICAIITFKVKEKKFPNNPILGWIVCTIGLAVGLYLLYIGYNMVAGAATLNAGYRDAFK